MRTLVFGATGYVGRHVVARLVAAGHSVTGFVRDERGAAQMMALGASPACGNLDDIATTTALFADHDHVVWAAQLMLEEERRFVEAAIDALAGTGKTFLFTGGTSLSPNLPTATGAKTASPRRIPSYRVARSPRDWKPNDWCARQAAGGCERSACARR